MRGFDSSSIGVFDAPDRLLLRIRIGTVRYTQTVSFCNYRQRRADVRIWMETILEFAITESSICADESEIAFKNEPILKGGRGRIVAASFAVNAVYGAYLGAIGLLLPQLGRAFHLDPAHQGRIMSASFIGCIAGVLICGYLADRLGSKRVLTAAGIAFGAGVFLVSISRGELAVLCAAPLMGAGGAGMQTAANVLIGDLFVARRGSMLNACQVAFACGAVIGPAIVAHSLDSGTSWRQVYVGIALFAALLTLVAVFQKSVVKRSAGPALDRRALLKLFLQPAYALLCIAQLFYAGAEVGFFGWMPTFFRDQIGSPLWAGRVVSVFWLAMTFGRLAMGPLLLRFRATSIGAVLAFSGAIGAVLAVSSSNAHATMLFVFQTGLCFGGIYSTILVEAGNRFPGNLGSAIGGIAAASSAGTSTIPWLVGALSIGSMGWRVALMVIPISVSISGVFLILLKRLPVGFSPSGIGQLR